MMTIKSYTDVEQSKVLAKILPRESADMRYDEYTSHIDGTPKVEYKEGITEGIPCWSLAALLSVLPGIHLKKYVYRDGTIVYYVTSLEYGQFNSRYYNNPVDVCYETILKLHKLNEL